MIEYNSQNPWTFLRWRGSVIPKASLWSLFSAAMALGLKMAELNDYITIHGSGIVTDNAAFGIYTGTLAFVLVFRTNKCYSRFWHCATSCCTLRAQLVEAASSLVCFTFMSKASCEDIEAFRRTLIALVSLLHATCLG